MIAVNNVAVGLRKEPDHERQIAARQEFVIALEVLRDLGLRRAKLRNSCNKFDGHDDLW